MICPKCDGTNVGAGLMFARENQVDTEYTCSDCGHCWNNLPTNDGMVLSMLDAKDVLLARLAIAILTSDAVTCVLFMDDSDTETAIDAILAELDIDNSMMTSNELLAKLKRMVTK